MKARTVTYLTIVGGVLLILLFIPHFFLGYPGISDRMMADNVNTEITRAVKIIWIFASITMLQCGIWSVLLAYKDLKTKDHNKIQQVVLGGGIVLFVFICNIDTFPNITVFYFLPSGLLILIPSLLRTSK
jgi:hypothetical protein